MEVVDLDKLLSKHDSPGRVSDGIERRRPGGKTNHVGDNHENDAGHSGLGGQTNLSERVVFPVFRCFAFPRTWNANCPE